MSISRSPATSLGWRPQIAWRIRTLWPLKATATPLGIGAFFVAYFWVLHHPLAAVTIMPLTALDHWVSFVPRALPLYASLWLYVSLAAALVKDRRELLSFSLGCLALSLLGLGIFLVWPTALPEFEIAWSRHTAFAFLKSVDATGNACPSLHVAFAVFAAFWLARLLRDIGAPRGLHVVNGLWCLGIVYSTLAVRQHVAVDALAGAALGAAVAAANLRSLTRVAAQRGPRELPA